jgi:hypothetical protein
LTDADYGVTLMRKAFHPDTGALADSTRLSAERDAMSGLFSGAIGLYKNPHRILTKIILPSSSKCDLTRV